MTAPIVHVLDRRDGPGVRTVRCCGWSMTAPTEQEWRLHDALLRHLGLPVPERFEPCHPICVDEHGHSDGCIYDDGLD
jgi:hypothetical protein